VKSLVQKSRASSEGSGKAAFFMHRNDIYNLISKAQKPARYVGGEYGAVDIDLKKDARLSLALAFPDLYEIGMSNLGTKILYYLLNQHSDFVCERVYAPATDFASLLKKNKVPLFSLESKTPLSEFDFVGFSLGYELSYTNVLLMLELAGIPLTRLERDKKHSSKKHSADSQKMLPQMPHRMPNKIPIIIAGGSCTSNPLPMSDFIDLFVIGDGEEILPKLLVMYLKCEKNRQVFLAEASKLGGVFVPSVHLSALKGKVKQGKSIVKSTKECKSTKEDKSIKPNDYTLRVKKTIVKNLDTAFYPPRDIIPNVEIVHQRAVIELFRGCAGGCRFCQAGYIYRPIRHRKPKTLAKQATALIKNTGYKELGLTSLSTGDYPYLFDLLKDLKPLMDTGVRVSLPSLRIDSLDNDNKQFLQRIEGKKTTLTLAPEAGTQRLRDVIQKRYTEDEIFKAAEAAFQNGYTSVKLYFMVGLPTETLEDVSEIFTLTRKIKGLYKHVRNVKKSEIKKAQERGEPFTALSDKSLTLSVSVNNFVPKPHTPFQWSGMASRDYLQQAISLLKEQFKGSGIKLSYSDIDVSILETLLGSGCEMLGKVILKAYKLGCTFDSWREHFNYNKWLDAFKDCGIDIQNYLGDKCINKPLPYSFVDVGICKDLLVTEREKAYK